MDKIAFQFLQKTTILPIDKNNFNEFTISNKIYFWNLLISYIGILCSVFRIIYYYVDPVILTEPRINYIFQCLVKYEPLMTGISIFYTTHHNFSKKELRKTVKYCQLLFSLENICLKKQKKVRKFQLNASFSFIFLVTISCIFANTFPDENPILYTFDCGASIFQTCIISMQLFHFIMYLTIMNDQLNNLINLLEKNIANYDSDRKLFVRKALTRWNQIQKLHSKFLKLNIVRVEFFKYYTFYNAIIGVKGLQKYFKKAFESGHFNIFEFLFESWTIYTIPQFLLLMYMGQKIEEKVLCMIINCVIKKTLLYTKGHCTIFFFSDNDNKKTFN